MTRKHVTATEQQRNSNGTVTYVSVGLHHHYVVIGPSSALITHVHKVEKTCTMPLMSLYFSLQ